MKTIKNMQRIYFSLFLFIIAGCAEVLEKDLTNKNPELFAPTNNIVSDTLSRTFGWQLIDGASKYELQIVSTGFDSIVSIPADTSVSSNSLTLSLSPGRYQWRIRAFNNSSSTPFCKPWTLLIY